MKKDNKLKKQKPKQQSNLIQSIKSIASYIGCIGIALVVMYYVNGTVGILLAAALICAFVISSAITVITAGFINAEVKLDKTSVSKGDKVNCVIRLSKRIFMPVPIIELYPSCSANLSKNTEVCRVSLAGKEINIIKISIKAVYSGVSNIGIEKAFLNDYLGIIRIRLKNIEQISPIKLSVYPNIPDVPVQTDFLKAAVLFSNDDDEEETDETAIGMTGLPGYDHREYFPGDSLKRINWKMSSKRDIYMIRLDEKPTGSGQTFFLDSPKSEENDYTLSVRDNVIEGMLAVLNMLVREGRDTVFFFVKDKMWQRADIHNTADVLNLQEQLSECEPYTAEKSVPPELLALGKTPICFTAATSNFNKSAAEIASEIPDVLMISAAASGLPQFAARMWIMTEEFELKKQV